MKEAALVQSIRMFIKTTYKKAILRKLADSHTRGLPDLQVIWVNSHGTLNVLEIETKTKRGVLSKLQEHEAATTTSLGETATRGRLVSMVARDLGAVQVRMQIMEALP